MKAYYFNIRVTETDQDYQKVLSLLTDETLKNAYLALTKDPSPRASVLVDSTDNILARLADIVQSANVESILLKLLGDYEVVPERAKGFLAESNRAPWDFAKSPDLYFYLTKCCLDKVSAKEDFQIAEALQAYLCSLYPYSAEKIQVHLTNVTVGNTDMATYRLSVALPKLASNQSHVIFTTYDCYIRAYSQKVCYYPMDFI